MKTKISFKRSMVYFNCILIILLVSFVSMYYVLNQRTAMKYNDVLELYNDIGGFYDELQNANTSFKSYLYTENEDDLKIFRQHVDTAYKYTDKISKDIQVSYKWKIELLNNMLDNYKSAANELVYVMDDTSYGIKYNEYLMQYSLIQKTGNTYYEYITDYITSQQVVIDQEQNRIYTLSVWFAFLGLTGILLYSILVVSRITKPLYMVLNNMNQIRNGEYDMDKVSYHNKEMELLCLALEDMAKAVKENIKNEQEKLQLQKEILEIENENLRKDELLAQSELRLLQNQINPHFLFNTLNMIYKMALAEQATDTADMVTKTSELLRYALDKSSRTSDLLSEIHSIRNYIYIQQKRFHERIHFILDVDETVPNVHVPGMLLQPLVENAVKHGMSELSENGEIEIFIQRETQYLTISVSDNGKGVETDVLEERILHEFKDEDNQSMGLYNVIQRIKMFYGDDATISFNSYPSCGFEVVISIRLEAEDV